MEMKTICETCEFKLTQNGEAFICSYECTYCESCASEHLFVCPNCKGELLRRPKRELNQNNESTQ